MIEHRKYMGKSLNSICFLVSIIIIIIYFFSTNKPMICYHYLKNT